MAQNTILVSGTTAATSSTFSVSSNSNVVVGLFGTGPVSDAIVCHIKKETPGGDVIIGVLQGSTPVVIAGPGIYKVVRPVTVDSVGVYTDS